MNRFAAILKGAAARVREHLHPTPPEAEFAVTVSEGVLCVTYPDGEARRVHRDDIRKVWVETNDSGPWGIDFWYVLEGGERTVAYPLGACGDVEACEWLEQLPGYRQRGVSSTANVRFECWPNPNASPEAT